MPPCQFTPRERELVARLRTPLQVQRWLNALPYNSEPDGETLVLSATNGLSQGGLGRVRLRIGEGVTGTAAVERAPVVVEDVRTEPRFRWLPGVDQARFVSMCSVPIVSASLPL